MAYIIKQHDTVPDINAQLLEADGTPIDLTTATTVYFLMKTTGQTMLKATCTVINALQGRVQYLWQAGNTDVAGTYQAEFEIHWGSEIQTVPNNSYLSITIMPDIDSFV